MASIVAALAPRQVRECFRDEDGLIDEDSCYVPFWYTKTGIIVKWSLFLGLITFIGLYLLIGYIHAQKLIKKGLKPKAYHRFLVPRSQLARVDPNYRFPQAEATPYYYGAQQQPYYSMPMHNMPNMPPPPVYDPNAARPPMYPGPPEGATKVDPSQQNDAQVPPQQTGVDYTAPPGPPPPSNLPTQNTGNSNPFRP